MKRLDFSKGWTFYKESSQKRETVDLPHDAMQYEPRGAEMPSGGAGAYYAGGIYRYEKVLDCAAELLDKHVELVFEGVYKDAQVYWTENCYFPTLMATRLSRWFWTGSWTPPGKTESV